MREGFQKAPESRGEMADYPDREDGAPRAASVATMANWAGALVSLLLIAGVAVWGYRLLVRDVTGVPVVKAAEGPMRVAPENPGGRPADHQGLAVNEVAANGGAEDVPERLFLAPDPITLDEDMDVAALPAEAAPEEQAAAPDPVAGAEAGEADHDARMAALVASVAGNEAPLSDLQPVAAVAPPQPAPQSITPAPQAEVAAPKPKPPVIDAPGVRVSLRPQGRPASLSTEPRPVAAAVTQGPRDIDPAEIPAGTRLVQLGAFESPEIARAEWDKLTARFDAFLEGKDRVVQRATSGGRTFYRLRAHGFADLSDARRFCAALVAENADCIPVVTR